MCSLYQASAADTDVFHHTLADVERSEMMGSMINSQSPRIKGPCWGSHGASKGRSGAPDLTVSHSFDHAFVLWLVEALVHLLHGVHHERHELQRSLSEMWYWLHFHHPWVFDFGGLQPPLVESSSNLRPSCFGGLTASSALKLRGS